MPQIKSWACWSGIIGALLLAFKIGDGYFFFIMSSILWISYGRSSDNSELVIMNVVFTVINVIGIFNWMFVK